MRFFHDLWTRMPWWLQDQLPNLVPIILVVVAIVAFQHAKREPLWADAFRRLRGERVAMLSLTVIMIYFGLAFLDSISWRANRAAPVQSLLQRLPWPQQEYYYSAPGAKETTGEPHPHPVKTTHIFGTDGIGNDTFFLTVRGVKTALIIGGLSLLIMTPIAVICGLLAGYFGKFTDDAIQYTYTVLDSIPTILLLISLMMVLGKGLVQVCIALGISSWVGLCRIVRGETLKLREREYVRAARALGVSHTQIVARHILPNLTHLIVINITLAFSGLVMYEPILAYLGLGVGPDVGSWGNMIDASRQELARDPTIWWNLAAASGALLILVLAFNLFSDALQDALNPRLRA